MVRAWKSRLRLLEDADVLCCRYVSLDGVSAGGEMQEI